MDIEKSIVVGLPEDIILEEIVARLPVKSVLRLRCVSKRWRGFIGSERFMKRHLQLSAKIRDRTRVVSGIRGGYECSLQSVLNKEEAAPLDVRCTWSRPCDDFSGSFRVVGCCNGLVCIFSSPEGRFYLWNPSTRVSKELPRDDVGGESPQEFDLPGFGWDESSDEYKVCAFSNICKVYSSKTNSWKPVGRPRDIVLLFGHDGQFVSGKVHWRSLMDDDDPYKVNIVSFDLKREVFGAMEMPIDCTSPCWSDVWLDVLLGVLGGCLCVLSTIQKQYLDVWVRKEEEEESWLKIIADVTLCYDPLHMLNIFSFGIAPNGDILFTCVFGFLAYNPKQKLLYPLKEIKGFYDAHLCIESLVHV